MLASAMPAVDTRDDPPRVRAARSRAGALTRPGLLERLDHVLDAGVGLVSAAAGYGKTTLLASWVAAREGSFDVAWLTLEPRHADDAALATDLAAALAAVCAPPPASTVGDVLAALAAEGQQRQRPTVLILDDAHQIAAHEVFAPFAALLERRPPGLHIVMSGRTDPPLAWNTLRARGELVEIRTRDMVLDTSETTGLLEQRFGLALADERAERLCQWTEGWVTGLCLAYPATQGRQDPQAERDARRQRLRRVAQYFEREVLRHLSDSDVAFLERTAVLDHLDPALCNHLTGRVDSLDVLRRLAMRNLFVEQVSVEPPRFRYHALLARRLRARLHERDPQRADALLSAASRWNEDRRAIDAAIVLALRCGDVERAATLIRSACGPTIRYGHAETVLRWLNGLPDGVVWRSLDLLIVLGRASGLTGDHATAETAVLAASTAIASLGEPVPPALRIALTELEASVRMASGALVGMIEPIEHALALYDTHAEDPGLANFDTDRESLQTTLAASLLLAGRFDEATSVIDAALTPSTMAKPTRSTVLGLGVRALALALAGDHARARRAARQGIGVLQAYAGPGSDAFLLHIARGWCDGPDADHGVAVASAIARRVGQPFLTAMAALSSAQLQLLRGAPVAAGRGLQIADATIATMSEPGVLATLTQRLQEQIPAPNGEPANGELNERELEVLTAIAHGATRRQAAQQLYLSINTVKTYLRTAYRKLGASDRDEAVSAARSLGLLNPPPSCELAG